ncbi:hypothetical protein ACFQ3W_24845 [Paenibacillus puldeungensis]|uniref:Benzylsuccinate synthase n=1 Tax=Paenibacillus puldeungensis TaxID=696536 RepID=A0ABW3S3X9_9BACL
MKCHDCKHYWWMLRSVDAPYGEAACMKRQQDLFDTAPEDVADCEDFEKSTLESNPYTAKQ